MLRLRVLTSLVLAPACIAVLFFAPAYVMRSLVSLILLIALLEWARLAGLQQRLLRVVYAVVLVALVYLADMSPAVVVHKDSLYQLACLWWLVLTVWLMAVQYLHFDRVPGRPVKLLIGLPTLLPMWFALNDVYLKGETGPQLTLYLLFLIWAADIGAYAAGRLYGRHKLASLISPGKTIEGLIGGLVAAALLALAGALFFHVDGMRMLWFVALGLLCALVSVVGDLFESLLKRQAGVKDSGNIIPGHGGMLDRIDSLTAAAPIFAAGLAWLAG